MSHTLAKLAAIVHNHNKSTLNGLYNSKKWLFPNYTTAPSFANPSSAITRSCASVSSHAFQKNVQNIGKFNNKKPPFDLWTFVRDALICSNTNQTEAVFSVIDNSANNVNEKLDVVLCVGINYGQFFGENGSPSHAIHTRLHTNTGMQNNVMNALRLAYQVPPNRHPLDRPFHLVVSNFFPWITNQYWGNTIRNSIGESILLIRP